MLKNYHPIRHINIDEVSITEGAIKDIHELQQLFVDTVTNVCKFDYDSDQIQAWVSGVKDMKRWQTMLTQHHFLVAKIEEKIVGFGSLNLGDHLHMFYVHKDYQKKGIATKLYFELQNEAYRQGKRHIYSDVSKTAKAFFTKHGFKVESEQSVLRGSTTLTNFRMRKDLV